MRFESGLWFFEQIQIFKKIKKVFTTYTTRTRCVNAVTDPDYADEGTGAESSSDEGEDTGPESSNDETRHE